MKTKAERREKIKRNRRKMRISGRGLFDIIRFRLKKNEDNKSKR